MARARVWRRVVDLEPLAFYQVSLRRDGPLLKTMKQTCAAAANACGLLCTLGSRRQGHLAKEAHRLLFRGDHSPRRRPAARAASSARLPVQQSAEKVVQRPAGLDRDDAAGGQQPRAQVRPIPVVQLFLLAGAHGLLDALERVVDQNEPCAEAHHSGPGTNCPDLGAALQRPALCCCRPGVDGDAQSRTVLLDQVANHDALTVSQILGVRSQDNRAARVVGQKPRGKELGVNRLPSTWRQAQSEPVGLASGDIGEVPQHQAVVLGRFSPRIAAPLGEVAADAVSTAL